MAFIPYSKIVRDATSFSITLSSVRGSSRLMKENITHAKPKMYTQHHIVKLCILKIPQDYYAK